MSCLRRVPAWSHFPDPLQSRFAENGTQASDTVSAQSSWARFERLIPSREIACWRKSDSISPQDGAAQQCDDWERGITLRQALYRYLDRLALWTRGCWARGCVKRKKPAAGRV